MAYEAYLMVVWMGTRCQDSRHDDHDSIRPGRRHSDAIEVQIANASRSVRRFGPLSTHGRGYARKGGSIFSAHRYMSVIDLTQYPNSPIDLTEPPECCQICMQEFGSVHARLGYTSEGSHVVVEKRILRPGMRVRVDGRTTKVLTVRGRSCTRAVRELTGQERAAR